jgi:hypothetical protein
MELDKIKKRCKEGKKDHGKRKRGEKMKTGKRII